MGITLKILSKGIAITTIWTAMTLPVMATSDSLISDLVSKALSQAAEAKAEATRARDEAMEAKAEAIKAKEEAIKARDVAENPAAYLKCRAIPVEDKHNFATCSANEDDLMQWCDGDCSGDDAKVTICCTLKH